MLIQSQKRDFAVYFLQWRVRARSRAWLPGALRRNTQKAWPFHQTAFTKFKMSLFAPDKLRATLTVNVTAKITWWFSWRSLCLFRSNARRVLHHIVHYQAHPGAHTVPVGRSLLSPEHEWVYIFLFDDSYIVWLRAKHTEQDFFPCCRYF